MSKKMRTKTIKDAHVSGRELKDMILGECLPRYREKHANPSFDGIETDETDALHQKWPHLRSDLNKLVA